MSNRDSYYRAMDMQTYITLCKFIMIIAVIVAIICGSYMINLASNLDEADLVEGKVVDTYTISHGSGRHRHVYSYKVVEYEYNGNVYKVREQNHKVFFRKTLGDSDKVYVETRLDRDNPVYAYTWDKAWFKPIAIECGSGLALVVAAIAIPILKKEAWS